MPEPGRRGLARRLSAAPGLPFLVALLFACRAAHADEPSKYTLTGYGTFNYFAFDWETDPARRNAIDLERLSLYPSVRLSERTTVTGEIEFEHGGTGSTVEFDRFEEFGEFEFEIEKGGEVELEQLHVDLALHPRARLVIGRFKLPIGLAGVNDEPGEYLTTTAAESEANVVPVAWCEDGIQIRVAMPWFGAPAVSLSLVNGLDSTGFSSATWIVRGQQMRFETANAEDFAVAGRSDWRLGSSATLGVSFYTGNTTGNRPKPDLDVPGRVTIGDVHATAALGPVSLQGVYIHGSLQNADAISRANRNLSNQLNVKRTPVGSEAFALGLQAAFDLSAVPVTSSLPLPVTAFLRYDRYDTMHRVTGEVFDNPRWERRTVTAGADFGLDDEVVLKVQGAWRRLGTSTNNHETTWSGGVGFEF